MGRRQLAPTKRPAGSPAGSPARLVLAGATVLVIALVLVALHVMGETDAGQADAGPDTPVSAYAEAAQGATATDTGDDYVREARVLAAALTDFSARAVTLLDHEPLVAGRSGLDEAAAALARVGERNGPATSEGRRLAAVAAEVGRRWTELRPVAMSEDTAEEGVLGIQALGREVGVRAAELTSILDTLSGDARRTALDAAVSRPWPVPGDEGSDTSP